MPKAVSVSDMVMGKLTLSYGSVALCEIPSVKAVILMK